MLPRPEVHPQAALYRQLVAPCRARRAADPYVVMERLPEGHPRAASRFRRPAESSLRLPPVAVRAEWPAVPVLRAQHPESVCRLWGAGPSASPVQPEEQPSALPLEAARSGVPGEARLRAAARSSGPSAAEAKPAEVAVAARSDARALRPGEAAAAGALAQQRAAAQAEVAPSGARVSGQAEAVLRAWAAVAEQPRAAALADAVAAGLLRVAARRGPDVPAELRRAEVPSPAVASTCPRPAQSGLAPAQSVRFAPATARLRIASP